MDEIKENHEPGVYGAGKEECWGSHLYCHLGYDCGGDE